MRQNHQGIRPRTYQPHSEAMRRLDLILQLIDGNNKPLKFTKTHRLRRTRGHRAVEQQRAPARRAALLRPPHPSHGDARYAATLAEVAEAEFPLRQDRRRRPRPRPQRPLRESPAGPAHRPDPVQRLLPPAARPVV